MRNFEDRAFAVVGMSQGGDALSVGGLPAGHWVDAVTGETADTADGGTLRFHVGSGGARVFLRDGPGKVGADGPYLR